MINEHKDTKPIHYNTATFVPVRAGVSAKIFETETLTLRDRDETETLSKNSRRERDKTRDF